MNKWYMRYLKLCDLEVKLTHLRELATEFKVMGDRADNPNMATSAKQMELGIDGLLTEIGEIRTSAFEMSGARKIEIIDLNKPQLTVLEGGGGDAGQNINRTCGESTTRTLPFGKNDGT
jgi:hypothetical protein